VRFLKRSGILEKDTPKVKSSSLCEEWSNVFKYRRQPPVSLQRGHNVCRSPASSEEVALNYWDLIKDSFWITLRNRYLWFFGFFAGVGLV
jgi:hypothetical protein